MCVLKYFISGIIGSAMLILTVSTETLSAQGSMLTDSTTVSKKDTASQPILLYPDALPDTRNTGFLHNPGQSFSTQISYIDGGLGLEMIYTGRKSRSFFSLMLGTIAFDEPVNYRINMLTSITYGYKASLRSSGSYEGRIQSKRREGIEPAISFFGQPQFYIRLGPGISTFGTEDYRLGKWESERLVGFHAFGLLGASVAVAERSRLNIEVGWRSMWFLASEDLRQMSGPHVTFGFSFSGSRAVNTVSW